MDIGGGDIGALQQNAEHNDGEQPENVNISDVLEAITLADPLFGGGVEEMARPPISNKQPSVVIEEQPASKALRFRYECEGRSAGSIPGANSTAENKTYPTLRINDYIGPCTIVASCVTKDEPYRPHPHNLVGRDRCDRGVCTIRANITAENPTVQFKNLGIQCVKKKDIEGALQQRAQLRVDPFRTGFDPRTYPSIELNSVRLAFQVFLPDSSGQMRKPLGAVVSDVINDKKAMGELAIVRASHCSGSVRGGTQLILLTEKVSREDVTVMFYDRSGWCAPATIILVHKQVAIVIETPPYREPGTTDHVQVEFRLQRGASTAEDDQSKPLPFEYIPEYPVKKRKTLISSLMHYEPERSSFQPEQQIKIEPNRSPPTHHMTSPPHQQMYSPVSPYQEQQQRWVPEHMNNPFVQDIPWQFQPQLTPQYTQSPSPMHMQTLSPMGAGGHISPHPPGHMGMSPGHMGLSPGHMGHVSPALVQMGHVSPALQNAAMSHAAPMGQMSPALNQQHNYQMSEAAAMETAASLPQLGLDSADFNLPSVSEQVNLSASDLHLQF